LQGAPTLHQGNPGNDLRKRRSFCVSGCDIEVVAEAEYGDAIVPAALDHRPDIAVIDIEMPCMDGLDAIAT
jgi:YesN/AraC family two-component response regulator